MPSAPLQQFHRRAYCLIYVNGRDVTNRLDPHLISVRVIDKLDGWSEASIELDDRDASLAIPPDDSEVKIDIGWAGEGPRIPPEPVPMPPESAKVPWESQSPYTFVGFVDSAESGFSRRGGGRRLWIDAKTYYTKSEMKSKMLKSWGSQGPGLEGGGKISISEPWSTIMSSIGLNGSVSPRMAQEKRGFWSIQSSPMQFGSMIARQLGGHFKQIGDSVYLFKKDEQIAPSVYAEWGINLISWRIKPFVGRPQYETAKSDWFHNFEGFWKEVSSKIGGASPFGLAKAFTQLPAAAPNKQVGEQEAAGEGMDSTMRRGTGWVIINGQPDARAGGRTIIIGARPGVDGNYRNQEVEHNYSRRGYTTRIDVDDPILDSNTYTGGMGWPKSTDQLEGTPEQQEQLRQQNQTPSMENILEGG
jgi:hypothetical protein